MGIDTVTKAPFTITVYDCTVGADVLDEAAALYSEIYAEPPYLESDHDFASFAQDLPQRAKQKYFRLVVARLSGDPLGFAMGHQLPDNSQWWAGAQSELPKNVTTEHAGRTFAVIELAVARVHRRKHIASRIHAILLAGLPQERVTLLVRPEADPAMASYTRWGYLGVGRIRPYLGAPIYEAMILNLVS